MTVCCWTMVQGLFPLAPPYGVIILERVSSFEGPGAPPVANAPGRLGSAFRSSIENADAVLQGIRDVGSQAGASVRQGLNKVWEQTTGRTRQGEEFRSVLRHESPERGSRASCAGSKPSRATKAGQEPENLLPRFLFLGAFQDGLRAVRRAPGTVKSRLVGKTATNETVVLFCSYGRTIQDSLRCKRILHIETFVPGSAGSEMCYPYKET